MPAIIISDPHGDFPPIEIKEGTTLIINRLIDCLSISEEVTVDGKIQGIVKEICWVPNEVRIRVVR